MMQLHFTGKNIDVTPALKAYTIEKFQPLQKRYSQISSVRVTFTVEHLSQIAEATVHMNGTELHATAKSDDMYASINALVDKLMGQINKQKEKIIDSHHHS